MSFTSTGASVFTGIVEQTGAIRAVRVGSGGAKLEVSCGLEGLRTGDSVAVDGVCLTVARVLAAGFAADVSRETLERSAIKGYRVGTAVNLERALKLGDRLGGHLVAGHVDRTARLHKIIKRPGAWEITVHCPGRELRYVADKGSVAVAGISLTVACKLAEGFTLVVVPHTLASTTVQHWRTGDTLNIEFDQIAKYVESMTARGT
jgi:riboflavin synthase